MRSQSKRVRRGRDGIATRCQFHQRFYVRIFRTSGVSAAFSSYVLACKKFVRKMRAFNVDEIDNMISRAPVRLPHSRPGVSNSWPAKGVYAAHVPLRYDDFY